MIYAIYGNDRAAVLKKSAAYLAMFQKKRPQAEIIYVSPESWGAGTNASGGGAGEGQPFSLDQLISSQGLFDEKSIIVMEDIFSTKSSKKEIMAEVEGKLADLAKSPNAFLFKEGAVAAATVKKLKEYAHELILCEAPKDKFAPRWGAVPVAGSASGSGAGASSDSAAEFNVFSITDAIAKKDKKQAWLLFLEAVQVGVEPEPLHGALWWCVKNAVLAGGQAGGGAQGNNAASTGQSPFVFSKSKKMFEMYGEGQLQEMLTILSDMYHEARRGNCNLTVELERFVLR